MESGSSLCAGGAAAMSGGPRPIGRVESGSSASTAAGGAPSDLVPLPPENMRTNSSRLGRPSLTSSCGRPGVSAIQSARPRIGGRGAGAPGGAEKIAARSARLEMPAMSTKPPRRATASASARRTVVRRSSTAALPSAPGGARSARAFSRSSMVQSPWSASSAVSSRRCSQASKASNSAARSGSRDREATSVSGKWRPTRSTEGTSTPAKASSGRNPAERSRRQQEAPRRRVEVGVEPAFAEGAALRLQPLAEPEVPGLDEVGLEAARREIAERRQLAVPPGDPRDVARDVHGSTGASHGVDLA